MPFSGHPATLAGSGWMPCHPSRSRPNRHVDVVIRSMGIDETLMREIVRRVLTVARPERIILFGSAATGQMTKDSDIDLLIVEPAPKNRHEESVAIADAIGDVHFPVDGKTVPFELFDAFLNTSRASPAFGSEDQAPRRGRRGGLRWSSAIGLLRLLLSELPVIGWPKRLRAIGCVPCSAGDGEVFEGSPYPAPGRISEDPRHQTPADSPAAGRSRTRGESR